MEFSAALMTAPGAPLAIHSVRLNKLHARDVLIRMHAAGVCHTDVEAAEGTFASVIPAILGHEGAGVVEDVGSAVTSVRKGDHVVCSPIPSCGACFYCRRELPMLCEPAMAGHKQGRLPDGIDRLTWQGQPVAQFLAVASFAQLAVVPETGAVRIPAEVPFDRACLLGCAVLTAVGAARRIARVGPGDSVCIVGCGPVGLNAVQGARLAGAAVIIAVDPNASRAQAAMRFGATHAVDPGQCEVVEFVRSLTAGRGADHAFETAGSEAALQTALEVTRPGGTVVILGKMEPARQVSLRYGSLMGDKSIRRSSLGGARAQEDIPLFAKAYLEGRLMLDELITQRLPLKAINEGFRRVTDRTTIRTVIDDFS